MAIYAINTSWGETYKFSADMSQASASISWCDGESTPFQTADVSHSAHVAAVLLMQYLGRDTWLGQQVEITEDDDGNTLYDGLTEEEYISSRIAVVRLPDEVDLYDCAEPAGQLASVWNACTGPILREYDEEDGEIDNSTEYRQISEDYWIKREDEWYTIVLREDICDLHLTDADVESEPVQITCLCWVKLQNGVIRPIPRRSRGFRYHWFIFDSGYVDDNGTFAEVLEYDGRDVIQVGEPLTDAEIVAAANGKTLEYTGTMLT